MDFHTAALLLQRHRSYSSSAHMAVLYVERTTAVEGIAKLAIPSDDMKRECAGLIDEPILTAH